MSIFRFYSRLKLLFEHNSARKVVFLSACLCWDDRVSFRHRGQKNSFGGILGCFDSSYLEFLFCPFEVFRLHAILHHAAGAVRAYSGKGPGYCYMIGRGPKSCLLGHVTGLLICLYVKLFLPSVFNSVDF